MAGFASWSRGDFDNDGDVDGDDYVLMVGSYNAIDDARFSALPTITMQNGNPNAAHYADMDGESDDSSYIQAAINALGSTGGTVVVPGYSNLGSTGLVISERSNVRLMGTGTGSGFTINGATASGAMLLIEQSSGISVRGLTFDGYKSEVTVGGINVFDSARVLIDGNRIRNMADIGIHALGNADNHYTNNSFDHMGNRCVWAGNYWDRSDFNLHGSEYEDSPVFVGNNMRRAAMNGIVGMMPSATIVGNDIYLGNPDPDPATGTRGGTSGIALAGVPAISGASAPVNSDDVVVMGNIVKNCNWQGLQSDVKYGSFADKVTVLDNEFVNNGQNGILIQGATDWAIIDNDCINNAYHGMQILAGHYLLVEVNDFLDNGADGISIEAYDLLMVEHPNFVASSNIVILNNIISDNDRFGIRVTITSDDNNLCEIQAISIEDNDLEDNGSNWLYIDDLIHPGNGFIDVDYVGNSCTGNGNGNSVYDNS
jgi:hypothetical protein